jgi:NAD(P)-dependent dehydrogenase (short-subunit alcohol dehydrogenase family)
MKEKVALITGSTDGIGKQTALDMARMGATVLVHGRNDKRCRKAVNDIMEQTGNKDVYAYFADLGSLQQIRKLSMEIHTKWDRLDILINNAGVRETMHRFTEDGFEMTFGVNYLAGFCLTGLLLDLMKRDDGCRIINVSSMVHSGSIDFENLQGEKGFSGSEAYSVSKLCNILFTYELAEKLQPKGITVNCLHPGVINTKLLRVAWSGGSSVTEGAKTSVFLASSPEVEGVTGKYFVNKKETRSSTITYDSRIRKQLWDLSEEMTGIRYGDI